MNYVMEAIIIATTSNLDWLKYQRLKFFTNVTLSSKKQNIIIVLPRITINKKSILLQPYHYAFTTKKSPILAILFIGMPIFKL